MPVRAACSSKTESRRAAGAAASARAGPAGSRKRSSEHRGDARDATHQGEGNASPSIAPAPTAPMSEGSEPRWGLGRCSAPHERGSNGAHARCGQGSSCASRAKAHGASSGETRAASGWQRPAPAKRSPCFASTQRGRMIGLYGECEPPLAATVRQPARRTWPQPASCANHGRRHDSSCGTPRDGLAPHPARARILPTTTAASQIQAYAATRAAGLGAAGRQAPHDAGCLKRVRASC
jgi:hypothetical protein